MNDQRNAQQSSTNSPGAAIARLGELSRDAQLGWIEKLFSRFEAMYGRLFADMWQGADLPAVKAEWAGDLRFYTGAQIAWALDQCRTTCDLPPTLPKFLGLCRAAPRPEVSALPAPKVEPEIAAARAQQVRNQAVSVIGRELSYGWAIRILQEIAAGVAFPSPASEQFAVQALANLGKLGKTPAEYVALNRAAWRRVTEWAL